MPRRSRYLPAGIPVHVHHRGNNRQICFAADADMAAYAKWLGEGARKYGVLIHAWVFMTNHTHLLLTPSASDSISKCIQHLGRHYVPYFNYRYRRTGTLYEGRFSAHLVQSTQYFLNCCQYIELNPVRAGMVSDPSTYSWSSYAAHAFGKQMSMWTAHEEYLSLGADQNSRQANYRQLLEGGLKNELVTDIRRSLTTGFSLGNKKFREQIELLTGMPQSPRKRGRKSRVKKFDL